MISHHNHSCITMLTSVSARGRKITSRRQNTSPDNYKHTTTLYTKRKCTQRWLCIAPLSATPPASPHLLYVMSIWQEQNLTSCFQNTCHVTWCDRMVYLCVLTTRPAFLTARGRPSSPVPMFPFNKWIRVWQKLGGRAKTAFMRFSDHLAVPAVTVECILDFTILTRSPSLLQSSHSYAVVWKVQVERDKEHPFLMDFGLKTKNLRRRREGRKKENNMWICVTR